MLKQLYLVMFEYSSLTVREKQKNMSSTVQYLQKQTWLQGRNIHVYLIYFTCLHHATGLSYSQIFKLLFIEFTHKIYFESA